MPTHRHNGKKSGRLLPTLYIQALIFMQFIHVLDPRDHNLALPCLALYLVVSFIACVGCLALLALHRLRLLYFVLEI